MNRQGALKFLEQSLSPRVWAVCSRGAKPVPLVEESDRMSPVIRALPASDKLDLAAPFEWQMVDEIGDMDAPVAPHQRDGSTR